MALMAGYEQTLDQGMDDLRRIVETLRAKHRRVGVLGYCLGGKLAFLSWLRLDVDAVVSYYGVGMTAFTNEVDGQQAPLLMHLGKDDPLNPPPAVAQIAAALAPLPNTEIVSHEGVGHAFARLGGNSYVAAAAQQAEAATLAFLQRNLQR
ncbi:Carboxymethylenebutenolidase [compost metagenome]